MRWDVVVAGPDGLDELIVIGDRTGAHATVEGDSGWASRLDELVDGLRARLDDLVPA